MNAVIANVRNRPITVVALVIVSLYAFWEGYIIHNYTVFLPPERRVGYQGPETLFDLNTWAYLYLAVGFLMLVRIITLSHRWVDLVLHIICMIPVVGWAAGFIYGPPTTGQPAYTFAAVVLIAIPFITAVVERVMRERDASLLRAVTNPADV